MIAQGINEITFEARAEAYKDAIDSRLELISESIIEQTWRDYGQDFSIPVEAYCSVLTRGGKRLRGEIAAEGYRLNCGQDLELAIDAGCVIEMLHASLLVKDDWHDQAETRRNMLTEHRSIERYCTRKGWLGDPKHLGRVLADIGASIGEQKAQSFIAEFPVAPEYISRAQRLLSGVLAMTGHGQAMDIIGQARGSASKEEVEKIMDLKTGHYSIRAPLQFGMILAGATPENLALVEPFAKHLGRAYQIRDDLLPYTSGNRGDKDPASDLREGKVNLVVLAVRERLSLRDRIYFDRHLGKADLSDDEFRRCRDLVVRTGAIACLMADAHSSVDQAVVEAEGFPAYFNQNSKQFLKRLAQHVVKRET